MKKPNFKKVTGRALLHEVATPLGCAALGTVAGAAAGRTVNLVLGAGLAIMGVACSEPNLIYAGAGAAVATPPKAMTAKGIDGLDGIQDFLQAAKNRAFGQTRNLLTNARLDSIADKIPVSGLDGLGEMDFYQQGYIEGVNDTVDEYAQPGEEYVAGLGMLTPGAGALPGGGNGTTLSAEAMLLRRGMM